MNTSPLYKLSYILIIATLVTMIFNSAALVIWTEKLPVNPVTDILVETAKSWHDLMNDLGLTIVFNKLREVFRFFRAL